MAVYLEVPDINAMLARIGEAGGKTLLPRSEIPGGPTIALFADVSENCLGLIEPAKTK